MREKQLNTYQGRRSLKRRTYEWSYKQSHICRRFVNYNQMHSSDHTLQSTDKVVKNILNPWPYNTIR